MTKMNLGVFNEAINEKADRDLRNIDLTKTDIVIEYQEPDASNNYTWYRLYASGWVEQGGFVRKASFDTNNYKVTFPITMQNLNFTITMAHLDSSFNSYELLCIDRNITDITLGMTGSNWQGASWQVSGKADMTGHEVLPSKKEKDENDHRVVAFQKPTAENGYVWYRKYADGWIEQGGIYSQGRETKTHSLIIEMSNANYNVYIQQVGTNTQYGYGTMIKARTTTSFTVYSNEPGNSQLIWRVEGLYA